MNHWMDDFLKRCLEGVPEGAYRDRTETELRDHLETLARDLEEAGYAPEEARTLAQSRMGDPAELAQSYVRVWKRRRQLRWPLALETALFDLCISAVGILYMANAWNFGNRFWVTYWGMAAFLMGKSMWQSIYLIFGEKRTIFCWGHMLITVFQLPPILCWMVFSGPFEMSGIMVPGWAGVLVHTLLAVWGAANWRVLSRLQAEELSTRTVSI